MEERAASARFVLVKCLVYSAIYMAFWGPCWRPDNYRGKVVNTTAVLDCSQEKIFCEKMLLKTLGSISFICIYFHKIV